VGVIPSPKTKYHPVRKNDIKILLFIGMSHGGLWSIQFYQNAGFEGRENRQNTGFCIEKK